MQRLAFFVVASALALAVPLAAPASDRTLAAAGALMSTEPQIAAMKGRLVTVHVPAGYERVTLQALTSPRRNRRAQVTLPSERSWKIVGAKYPRGEERVITFRLSRLTPRRHLRVVGEKENPLSESLLSGISSFLGEAPPAAGGGGAPPLNAGGKAVDGALSLAASDSATEARAVAEADIWKHDGDRLYFFNERRGLQVFDVHAPDAPALLGTLRMPGMGEDMYLLDAAHVVLLKRAWDFYWWDFQVIDFGFLAITPQLTLDEPGQGSSLTLSADASSIAAARFNLLPQRPSRSSREIVIADVSAGQPRILSRIAFEGTVRESRLVGKVLYLATDAQRVATEDSPAAWGLEVTSFDLHDPANPIRRQSIHLGGWANAVMATDRYFFIAKWQDNYNGQAIDVLDIADPNGAMQLRGQAVVEGSVHDKFKMHFEGDVFTVVSAIWRSQSVTRLTTFSLSNDAAPRQLATLDLAPGETVRATRFDRGRAYVVTFVQIDPLWVIDLRDPALPRVLGHVEAPGFSTYIEPLGDRLVTIGLVNGRPAVSLFDVGDAETPKLLSQVVLGGRHWSYSEANSNEKAFTVLPDQRLILVPLNSWGSESDDHGGVQLLDLLDDTIVKRGIVREIFEPRRTTSHRNRLLAISPTHLVSVDAEDRDAPKITAKVEIAWSVNRLFNVDGYLVQVSEEPNLEGLSNSLTVSPAADPDDTLSTLELSEAAVVGATVRERVLYLLQMRRDWDEWTWDLTAAADRPDQDRGDDITISAFDLSRLPAITLLGTSSSQSSLSNGLWGIDALPHWLNATTLAFSVPRYDYGWFNSVWDDQPPYVWPRQVWVNGTAAGAADAGAAALDGHYESQDVTVDPPGYWRIQGLVTNTQRVFAFDVTDPAKVAVVSAIELGTDQPWAVATPVADAGRLLVSHQFLGPARPWKEWDYQNQHDVEAYAPISDDPRTNRHFLQIIDYANPEAPFVEPREPNLPGRLVGAIPGGRILLTLGQKFDASTGVPDPETQVVHSSALDGLLVHLVDQLPVRDSSQPLRLRGNTVFLLDGQPAKVWKPNPPPAGEQNTRFAWWGGTYEDNPRKSSLGAWRLGDDAKFAKLDELELEHETAFYLYGDLGAVYESAAEPRFLDLSNAEAFGDLGFHRFEGAPFLRYDRADGGLESGLWIPAERYGVEPIVFAP